MEVKLQRQKRWSTRSADIPLLYQPGTKWVYSLSVDVLGRLIEVVSGQALDVFLQERMFGPLDMDDTFFEVPKNKVKRFGTNHQRSKDGILTVMERPESSAFANEVTFFSGGHGLLSTAMDYLRYLQMMLNGGALDGVSNCKPDDYRIDDPQPTQRRLSNLVTAKDPAWLVHWVSV